MEEWDENAQNTMYEILKELIRISLKINPNKGQTTKLKMKQETHRGFSKR